MVDDPRVRGDVGDGVLAGQVLTVAQAFFEHRLTGDAFHSLKCDCGAQLDHALQAIAREGRGVLLYLRQEGRGIGLVNKVRAYALQDAGADTVDANRRLGLPDVARDYRVAARMLAALGVRRVRLLTNNPAKVAALQTLGVDVTEHLAHQVGRSPHNTGYLQAKAERMGHWLPGGQPAPGRTPDTPPDIAPATTPDPAPPTPSEPTRLAPGARP